MSSSGDRQHCSWAPGPDASQLCEEMKTESSDINISEVSVVCVKEEMLELNVSNSIDDHNTSPAVLPKKEEDLDEDYLYCEACKSLIFKKCEVHGQPLFIPDIPVPMGVADHARQTLPPGLESGMSSIPDAGVGVFNNGETVPVGSSKPKAHEQTFSSKYLEEFPFICSSKVSAKHAFCKPCRRDFMISHRGRLDIVQHCKSKVHHRALQSELEVGRAQTSLIPFTSKRENTNAIKAECLFAAFYVEHNIPVAAADHMGNLLRAAFPNSEEVKQFHAGRTKTSCIVKEMAADSTATLVQGLKCVPYSIAIVGSHTSDAKLYPLVITYPDSVKRSIQSCLLSMPTLTGASSAVNIGELVLSELRNLGVPIQNCLSLSSDNSPVMLGTKGGVIAKLRESQPNLLAIGCPCHLINLAAQHAAHELPVSIDSLLIDVFYYFESSVNRKKNLQEFQTLMGSETQKILQHVYTRWLSLGLCLPRFNSQWDILQKFFESEVRSSDSQSDTMPLLKSFTTPNKFQMLADKNAKDGGNLKRVEEKKEVKSGLTSTGKRKAPPLISVGSESKKVQSEEGKSTSSVSTDFDSKKRQLGLDSGKGKSPKDTASLQADTKSGSGTRPERIVHALSSNLTRAFSCFLQFSIFNFQRTSENLQTNKPLIHSLKDILETFLKNQMATFLKPSSFRSTEVRYINYKDTALHKNDIDISIGNSAFCIVRHLDEAETLLFFQSVKKYYIKSCDYIISKFPLTSDVLLHAQVADVNKRDSCTFNSLRFFFTRFPVLVKTGIEDTDEAINNLAIEFNDYCSIRFKEEQMRMPADEFWFSLSHTVKGDGTPRFQKLSHCMLGILSIPHSNAECERIVSQVRKNKTGFRGSLSDDMLSALLIQKSRSNTCYEQTFTASFLKRAKAATKEAVKKDQ